MRFKKLTIGENRIIEGLDKDAEKLRKVLEVITPFVKKLKNKLSKVQDILHGIETKNYEIIYDRASAIEHGLFLYPDSVVLVAGKGSEKFLLSGDNKIEISDFGIIDGILNGTNK